MVPLRRIEVAGVIQMFLTFDSAFVLYQSIHSTRGAVQFIFITREATQAYKKGEKRIVIDVHPKKQYGEQLIKALLSYTGWTENDLRKLKLIK